MTDTPDDRELPTPPPPGTQVNRYGRTGALTPELQEQIVRVVRAGNYLKVAAQFCGIGESTLRLWLTKGRKAADAIDRHNPDRVYCPSCDADRTAAVRQLDETNAREDALYEAELAEYRRRTADLPDGAPRPEQPMGPAQGVLNRCPSCHSDEYPRQWTLPDQEQRYLAFLEAVTQAETVAEVAAVTQWRAAFVHDWRAARDYLVRRQPDRWAARTRVSISTEEAEARMDRAVLETLTALGVDTDHAGLGAGDLDPDTAMFGDLDPASLGDSDGDADHDPGDW